MSLFVCKSMSKEEDFSCIVPDFDEAAKNITLNLLPPKSKAIYEKTYNDFLKWCAVNKVKTITENVLLVYFDEQSKIYKPTSLWSRYSMIKANLAAKENIDVSQFKRLFAFLKRQSEGYEPKKSKILNREQITKFFLEAPDDTFLMMKVRKSLIRNIIILTEFLQYCRWQ